MLDESELRHFQALTDLLNDLRERVKLLEAQLQPKPADSDEPTKRRRRRYSDADFRRIQSELIVLSRVYGAQLPRDAILAERLGVDRSTFVKWRNSDKHPIGQTYRAIISATCNPGPPVVDRHMRSNWIASLRFQSEEDSND